MRFQRVGEATFFTLQLCPTHQWRTLQSKSKKKNLACKIYYLSNL